MVTKRYSASVKHSLYTAALVCVMLDISLALSLSVCVYYVVDTVAWPKYSPKWNTIS